MFNKWKKFPEYKPDKDGWYITTVEIKNRQRYVMELYYYKDRGKFIDNIRQSVIDNYDVYGRMNNNIKMTYKDLNCDRTDDVIAWKMSPKAYMKGFIKKV